MDKRTSSKPTGFTLLELMIVIAIIGVLVGLLLPAVQAAREAGRRMQCSNNIAQNALALHSFELVYGTLPSGVTNPDGPIRYEPIGEHTSWTVRILPYLENIKLYEGYDASKGVYAPENYALREARLYTLRCPSSLEADIPPTDGRNWGVASSYAGNSHSTEKPIDTDNDGVLFLNSRLPFFEIKDGLSNTLLISEKINTHEKLGWYSGTRATLRNTIITSDNRLNYSTSSLPNLSDVAIGSLDVGGFSSNHTGGFNAARCDGSVSFISDSSDTNVYSAMGSRADGTNLHTISNW